MAARISHYLCVLLVLNALTACGGGGGGSSSGSSNSGAAADTLTGTISFDLVPLNMIEGRGLDYDRTISEAAGGVVVEALDASNGSCNGTVLASTITDLSGAYSLSVDSSTMVCVRANARLRRTGSPSWEVVVVDNTQGNSPYHLNHSTIASIADQPVRNIHAGSGWGGTSYTGQRSAAPFAILHTARRVMERVVDDLPALQAPLLTFAWSTQNTTVEGDASEGEIGGAFFNPNERTIYLLGSDNDNTDEYDRHVIAHEMAHYLSGALSRLDSLGGSHGAYDRLDPTVAYEEGWADAFSVIAFGEQLYRDSLGPGQGYDYNLDIEAGEGESVGWWKEETVFQLVYDLFDGVDTSESRPDPVSGLGLSALLNVIANEQKNSDALTTIFSFVSALKQAYPAQAGNIDTLVNAYRINSDTIDAFATTEYNAPLPNVLPLYSEISSIENGGRALTLCSVNSSGTLNKLSNYRYLRFTPQVAGTYRFIVDPVAGSSNLFAGLIALERGVLTFGQQIREEFPGSTLVITESMELAPYVLMLFDRGNVQAEGPGDPGHHCFDVSVNRL